MVRKSSSKTLERGTGLKPATSTLGSLRQASTTVDDRLRLTVVRSELSRGVAASPQHVWENCANVGKSWGHIVRSFVGAWEKLGHTGWSFSSQVEIGAKLRFIPSFPLASITRMLLSIVDPQVPLARISLRSSTDANAGNCALMLARRLGDVPPPSDTCRRP